MSGALGHGTIATNESVIPGVGAGCQISIRVKQQVEERSWNKLENLNNQLYQYWIENYVWKQNKMFDDYGISYSFP